MKRKLLLGEQSPTLVAAMFGSNDAARIAVEQLQAEAHLKSSQIDLLRPDDPQPARKLEPETRGIWRTIKRSHVTLGATGLVAGGLLGLALYLAEFSTFLAAPLAATSAFAIIGLFFGLLAAGLLSLRPDHDRVIEGVRKAIGAHGWAVIAHPTDQNQAQAAGATLRDAGGEVIRSI
jgi:hypothetical protein